MKKQSTLLKVVSILLIIFGILGLISNIFSLVNLDNITNMMETLGVASIPMPSASNYIVAIIASLVQLAAGIIGVMYRSRKLVLIVGCIYVLAVIVDIIFSIVTIGFGPLYVLSLILPLLYMWGWYQSN